MRRAIASQVWGHGEKVHLRGQVLTPRDGSDAVKSGRLELVGKFSLHGRGCLFSIDTGEEIDVDWDDTGRAVFDSWRLKQFAESVRATAHSQEDLRLAAAASPSTIQLEHDLFAWATSKHDIVR